MTTCRPSAGSGTWLARTGFSLIGRRGYLPVRPPSCWCRCSSPGGACPTVVSTSPSSTWGRGTPSSSRPPPAGRCWWTAGPARRCCSRSWAARCPSGTARSTWWCSRTPTPAMSPGWWGCWSGTGWTQWPKCLTTLMDSADHSVKRVREFFRLKASTYFWTFWAMRPTTRACGS